VKLENPAMIRFFSMKASSGKTAKPSFTTAMKQTCGQEAGHGLRRP
jgi:hypothetical protein